MKYCFKIIASLFLLSALYACKGNTNYRLEEGIWRATLKTSSGAEIPFNFEVTDSAGQKVIDLINGEDQFRVNEISQHSDSVLIRMPLFDTEIHAKIKDKTLSGNWIKHMSDSDMVMPFEARHGESWRFFKVNSAQEAKLSGRWSVSFSTADHDLREAGIGEFEQKDGRLYGTFIRATGDHRFLEGTISDKKIYLSAFDGANAFLFTGKLLNDSTIVDGMFYSGFSLVQNWTAKKDDIAILPDAYSITALKDGFDKIDFSFPDLNGKKVSLSDSKFKNKVVLIQFFGSWCPNCMDETAYLVPFHKKYQDKGLEIVALAYERTTDYELSKRNILRLRDRFDVPYDMLITGYTNDKTEVAQSLPMLKSFVAFPTLIILDKKGKVRKIHTGFSGPGTGIHYANFKKEFEETIDNLLLEQ
ncbi:MAG: redoxin [Sphingobacteriales bacterium 17-39-43]|uniref:TlpA disulfide reductase family protein n=1 Tax=Daejeonella sp. TaxID=2805397 RepID=UPI000BD7DD4F|nr:TlpA disulfide reductase family protein [Daejeonella sp.]OYZ30820.1 MAG: redoxin [Sphingobacteriales bacterium 16-39-50]OYZ59336.1 MAG: redoxin [Sphingobacteriales bacterium 24-40-4]OZA23560.1 MAG: redoxin [Sphingobacteriales bacterium 17-39-43]HQT23756.1 TlpA disulfide reductase family protein [Daejeonella sp.]HQT58491.1 TlpA disulfide reductase family protein [Daejeonella sp.]